ncbi:hypothetical protein Zmor_026374 [Zophobas morio]|uniref:Endonuclease/exonuclease/phosphatase domain-containing protein n=1 Tax=Zophobas morio TaxID=2755281 RepID=A0AA38HW20_9CUCU|nr:hypothetical protein Zmor_026374 [Zophobas morio]
MVFCAILCITETWLQNSIPNSIICPPDYSIYRSDRADQRGGGVAILLKNSCFSNFQISTIDISINSVEILALCIRLKSFNLLQLCIYRPPTTTLDTDNSIIATLSELIPQYSQVIITGDFNLPNLNMAQFTIIPIVQNFFITTY